MKRGYYLVLMTAIISGASIFLNKFAVTGLNPYTFTFGKNIIAAIFLFSLILLMKEWKELLQIKRKHWIQLMIIGFIGGSIPFLLFFKGLQTTSAANAAFIHKTMFIFIAALAAIFLKEKLSKGFYVGALMLLAGNALLLNFAFGGLDYGTLMVLGATLFWAIENTISKHALKELSSRIVAFGRMFFGSIFIFLFLLMTGTGISYSTEQAGWTLFTSILLLLYAVTWYEGIKTIQVSTASCVLLLGSAVTTALSLLSGSPITAMQGIGTGIILSGITIAGASQYKLLLQRT